MDGLPKDLLRLAAGALVMAAVVLCPGASHAADASVQVIAPETRYTPWLGLTLREPDEYDAPGLEGGTVRGLVVLDVTKGGPADMAGLEEGDVILSLDGSVVEGYEDFSGRLKEFEIGSTVKLLVDRDGGVKGVYLALGSFPLLGGYGFLDPWLKDYLAERGEYGGCNWLKGYHEYDLLFYGAFASLELSDEQKRAARDLMSGFEKEMIRLSAEVRVGEIELKELLVQRDVDLKKVRAKLGEISGAGAEAEYVRVKTREGLKRILSKEQRKAVEGDLGNLDGRGWMWRRHAPAGVVPLPPDG